MAFKYLVIVESPAKSKTLEKYLGKDYKVLASMGHLRDLPKSRLAIDVENNFEPSYCIIKGKSKLVKELRQYAAKAQKVYLAPDPDREGEAIAWHLVQALALPPEKFERIEFNEITKTAVLNSFAQARQIDFHRVNAQQARRLLDRLVGYKISPLLWKRVRRGLSAGRVQSAALHLLCEREGLIKQFSAQEYWNVDAQYQKDILFQARVFNRLAKVENFTIPDAAAATAIRQTIQENTAKVLSVNRRERRKNPYAPFITSTLQQDASKKLGFNTRRTMVIAQQLYEGVDIGGEGQVGLITYMRTDSTRIAEQALTEARDFVAANFGRDFLPSAPNIYKQNKSAQDAHESIRPTAVARAPETLAAFLNTEQLKLYTLIWRRFVSSQMLPAVYDQTTIEIQSGDVLLKTTGSIIKEPGFLKVYEEATEDNAGQEEETARLPVVQAGEVLQLVKVDAQQCFTQPPARYTEAALVKALEELGIGRPSTYAPIISTLQFRNYVEKQGRSLAPTELGTVVDKQMQKHFPQIVDAGFTAGMELELDGVEEGKQDWQKMLDNFYKPFAVILTAAEEKMEDMRVKDRPTDEVCDKCGKPMVIKSGRFGDFIACTGFPECRNTKAILKTLEDIVCPQCGAPLAERKSKRGRLFYGCSAYPECNFASWDKPLKENCPRCGAFLVERKDKASGEKVKLCIMCDIKAAESEKPAAREEENAQAANP
ncbi:DNA topoisomerase I [Candidatus Termititenax persephonae]|uniref:DNA topoisomerase 1 n=1 Tax=Candidatus Termititenax persephonae TaxID=2218525 RepID=A0A388THG3_9BACT|nr:DNA topoisomerase I [Candidatus Termititenax persephonae]